MGQQDKGRGVVAKRVAMSELVKRLGSADERIAAEAGMALSERLEEDELPMEELIHAGDDIFAAYRQRREALLARQQPEGIGWMWDEDYTPLRYEAELLLDLIGHLPTPDADAALREALAFRDPQLRFWVVLGLLRQGKDVEQAVIDELAARHVVRNKLFHLLTEADMADRFPREFATQEAFAVADMVDWLTYPTELAREPDAIEQMAVVSEDLGEPIGLADYFVFRFRTLPPHWAAEQGWMSGVSGPYPRAEEPTPDAQGQTFSTFQPWGEATPEQLVKEVQELFEGMLGEEDEE